MMAGQAPEPLRIGVLGAARIAAHGVERVLDGYA